MENFTDLILLYYNNKKYTPNNIGENNHVIKKVLYDKSKNSIFIKRREQYE